MMKDKVIQIVIKISEDDYILAKKQVAEGITNPLKICIATGTPLRPEEKEEPDCKYYHGDLDGRCFGQKGAPACPCGGVSRRCDIDAE